jgi:histidine triad (HIT) family protein
MQDPNCVFCKIVRGEIPCRKVYENEEILAFHDIHPVAPVHVLIVPKVHVSTMMEVGDAHKGALGAMMLAAPRIARELGSNDGFRLIVNSGRVGRQEVMHVHMHVVGGPEPLGPMITRPKKPEQL